MGRKPSIIPPYTLFWFGTLVMDSSDTPTTSPSFIFRELPGDSYRWLTHGGNWADMTPGITRDNREKYEREIGGGNMLIRCSAAEVLDILTKTNSDLLARWTTANG